MVAYRPDDRRVIPTLLDLWCQSRADWRFITERLAQAFRAARHLHSAERRVVADTLYGMVRRVRTLDHVLQAQAPLPPADPAAPWRAEPTRERAELDLLAYRLLFEGLPRAAAEAARPDLDWRAVEAAHAAIAEHPDPLTRFGLTWSLPDWVARRLLAELGEADAAAFAAALDGRAPMTLRANTLKTSREALAAHLAAQNPPLLTNPTAAAPDGLVLETRTNAFGLQAFKDGLFEVQDEASQLVAALVAPPVHGLVIDACAGAGGKTLALGALMRNKGRLVAMDMAAHKLTELMRRARRAGLTNHRTVTLSDDGPLPDALSPLIGKADRVFIDAPCSGVGSMRRNPEARWRMRPEFIDALPDLQLRIALRALPLLAPGGRLVYATCTIFREENEEVVAKLRAAEPRLVPISAKEILGKERVQGLTSEDGFSLRTYPHRHGMDGFFAAALRLMPA